jgi:hypothetical protein
MANMFVSLFRETATRSSFYFMSRYVRPELLMAALYAVLWVDPLLLGQKTFEGLTWGLFLEFVFAHAHTGTAVVSMAFPPSTPKGKIAVTVISVFYLIFVTGLSIALGSVITFILFLILSVKRITAPQGKTDFAKEIMYAFFKVMIFVLTGSIGAGLGFLLPADLSDFVQADGSAAIIPAWGTCYFVALYFYEDFFSKKYAETAKAFSRIQKKS